jgi:pyridoxal phosphate enzyme (YggS family)
LSPHSVDLEQIRDNHQRVLERIARAAERAARSANDVQLVAVTKTVSAERLTAAVAAGITVLGENRVQEAESKAPSVTGVTWHLVGPLQGNKARRAVNLFDVIETVDSVGLARRLAGIVTRDGRVPYPVLLQVNVDRDPAKAGFDPDTLAAAIEDLRAVAGLDYRGLMTVGRLVDEPEAARPTFVALRELSKRLRAPWPALGPELSMGMTDDFEVAVEEGATIVRIGRALFGERPAP